MNSPAFEIREMCMTDYDEVFSLWQRTDNIGLSEGDSRENIEAYLVRNPGMSLIARRQDEIVGAILAGHDGRRGYLHHLAVSTALRKQGLGRKLVDKCLSRLQSQGIQKCHILLLQQNTAGQEFWTRAGWALRTDLKVMSRST